ncbi:hypothetical protein [Amycolatopsis sp. CA-230715]|uniref:hypothetical protein n=1 Tax=Amycolatopsis sp. CA-230715 TaxID=2745196 RepID=UPI001C02061E|nr:hypothetical protein [Amycolatopsis sp. CA-230715]QWF81084.1 hypothetical protein HUW46_04510 [Amycolatopsis sp. CA-230715]
MDEVLTATLQQTVVEHLNYLDVLVADGDTPSKAALAETEVARLTAAWRRLLDQHAPDSRGRCARCSPRWRHNECTVWETAHQQLIGDDAPSGPDRAGRHRLRPVAPARQLTGG